MCSPGRPVGFDDFLVGNSGHRLQGVDILREGPEEKPFGVDEALEVVARRRLHAGVEKLFGQEEKRLRVGQIKVNLEKALRLRQVEFGSHRVVKTASGTSKVGNPSLGEAKKVPRSYKDFKMHPRISIRGSVCPSVRPTTHFFSMSRLWEKMVGND